MMACLLVAEPDGPRLDGAIPEPPARREAWTPPATKLPRFLLDATATLCDQGLADPRGCEYREIRLEGDPVRVAVPGEPSPPPRHGFVLPTKGQGGSRFAIGWDGLIEPIAAIGPAADLDADVKESVESGGRGRPLSVVLLLRLGRADLAERVWSAATGWTADRSPLDLTDDGVSYLTLATEWAWSLFDRGVRAHSAGDDPLALASFRELARIQPLIEAKALSMGFPRRRLQGGNRVAGVEPESPIEPYLDFLGPFPALLADQERRAREPKVEGDPSKIVDRDTRIRALIRRLDEVDDGGGHTIRWDGSADSAIVQALVKEGDVAFEPLLDCLEHDDRLTRTIHRNEFHGPSRYVNVGTVADAAYSAIVAIMSPETLRSSPQPVGGVRIDLSKRASIAAAIRTSREKNRGLSEQEILYRTLADDHASPDEWMGAAQNLAGWFGFWKSTAPALGEPLRGRKQPSVTELMARRIEAIDPSGAAVDDRLANPNGSGAILPVLQANRFAKTLVHWDLAGSVPTLQGRVGRCRAIIDATRGEGTQEQELKVDLAEFTLDRLRAGDPRALDDYASWVRTVPPGQLDTVPLMTFEPIWRNPDHPAIAAAAVALFDDPKSPWVPLFRPRQSGWGEMLSKSDVISSPLLGVAPFRKLVLAGLADRSPTGTIFCDAEGNVEIDVDDHWSIRPAPRKDDPLRPKPSTKTPLRLADLYCWKLAGLEVTPRFELYWPEAKRDAAIAECVALLNHSGERFRFDESIRPPDESRPYPFGQPRAILAFPKLDRPASADDVRARRAIFHLDAAEVRLSASPKLPIVARWTKLAIPPDDPLFAMNHDETGTRADLIEILQGGTVWQAEEANEGGTWKRYYGFVGSDRIARVPAEEVEFPLPWSSGWTRVSATVDGRVIPPGGRDDGARIIGSEVSTASSLPVELWLRNRRGVESTIPVDYVRTDGGVSLSDGVNVRLFRLPVDNPSPRQSQRVANWVEIPARLVRRHQANATTRLVEPAGSTRAFVVDLRDLFEVTSPGRYRVEWVVGDEKDAEGKPIPLVSPFTITAPSKPD
jgi:hypothetical protein